MPVYEINIGGEPVEKGSDQDIVEIGQTPAVDGNKPEGQLPDVMPGLQEVPFDDKEEKPEVNIGNIEGVLHEIAEEEQNEADREAEIEQIKRQQ